MNVWDKEVEIIVMLKQHAQIQLEALHVLAKTDMMEMVLLAQVKF